MTIDEILEQLLEARYGKDVRQAIHDAIQKCYEDGKAGAVDDVARSGVNTLTSTVEDLITTMADALSVRPAIRSGSNEPDDSIGEDGDIYLKIG